jgi:hypothetical protein
MTCYRVNFTISYSEKRWRTHVAARLGRPGIALCHRDGHIVPREHAPAEHPSRLTRRHTSIVTDVRYTRFSQQCCWNSNTAVKRCHVVGWVLPEASMGLRALNFGVQQFLKATLPTDWWEHHDTCPVQQGSLWYLHTFFLSKIPSKYFMFTEGGVPYI